MLKIPKEINGGRSSYRQESAVSSRSGNVRNRVAATAVPRMDKNVVYSLCTMYSGILPPGEKLHAAIV